MSWLFGIVWPSYESLDVTLHDPYHKVINDTLTFHLCKHIKKCSMLRIGYLGDPN